MHRRLPRLLVLASLCGFSGCMSWKSRDLTTEVAPVFSGNDAVMVTRGDYSVITLESPSVVGDSLIGMVGNPPQRSATAWREVRALREKRVNVARTGGALVGTYLIIGVIVGLVAVGTALGQQ